MPQERLSVRKIQEVLRLKWQSGLSNRAIARSCSISPTTVSEYIHRAQEVGLSWPLPEAMDEDQLYWMLFPKSAPTQEPVVPLPDWQYIHRELRRKSVTRRLLWLEYRESHPDGYSYSRFCELYRLWAEKLDPPMRLTHKAEEKMFVDYAGQTVRVVDPETGEIQEAHIFIAVLGASNYTYAEAHRAEDLPNWIAGHVAAFAYFGGVSEIVVPDNPKVGVKHPSRYEPDINPTYLDMAEHYGTIVLPARIRKPKDKAKVEVGVLVVERWILARLRDRIFFGLSELNQAIRKLLHDLNHREMHHLGKSRCELFEELDQPALKPLPNKPYEFAAWKKAKVHIDYHVEFEKHYYSVPHELIKEKVWIRATRHTVEIFHKHLRVASHLRCHARGRHSTHAEHMPANHPHYAEWSPARFLHWAEEIGPQTRNVIEAALNARRHPQQAYRTCLGILSLAKGYGKDRLEAASGRALASGICSYRGIKNILDAGLDQVPLEKPVSKQLDSHTNIRGPSYYH